MSDLKRSIIDKFKDYGWYNLMKGFLLSEDFDKILEYLQYRWENYSEPFTPNISKVFSAFEACPPDKLKVLILGQDPYPKINVANGVAFSAAKEHKTPVSLRYIINEINKTVYDMRKDPETFDNTLEHITSQGVLLINSALTTVVGKPGKHVELWKPFISYLIDMLKDQDIVWCFLGKQAASFEDFIPNDDYKVLASHPASAIYSKQKEWDSNNAFNKINNLLEIKGKTPLVWWA